MTPCVACTPCDVVTTDVPCLVPSERAQPGPTVIDVGIPASRAGDVARPKLDGIAARVIRVPGDVGP